MARALKVTQRTAWFMDHRIRFSLGMSPGNKLSGQVEADETFIGGKARNMHANVRAKKITRTGGKDKTAVMGILERGGKVRVKVVPNRKKNALQSEIREHVVAGSAIFTDALKSYEGLNEFQHEVVDHAVEYVLGEVHTNGLENLWSLLKRGLNGTYVSVEPFHLFRYLDEQAWRYNNAICLLSQRRSRIQAIYALLAWLESLPETNLKDFFCEKWKLSQITGSQHCLQLREKIQ